MVHECYCGCVVRVYWSESGKLFRGRLYRLCPEAKSLRDERDRSNIAEYKQAMNRELDAHYSGELLDATT